MDPFHSQHLTNAIISGHTRGSRNTHTYTKHIFPPKGKLEPSNIRVSCIIVVPGKIPDLDFGEIRSLYISGVPFDRRTCPNTDSNGIISFFFGTRGRIYGRFYNMCGCRLRVCFEVVPKCIRKGFVLFCERKCNFFFRGNMSCFYMSKPLGFDNRNWFINYAANINVIVKL